MHADICPADLLWSIEQRIIPDRALDKTVQHCFDSLFIQCFFSIFLVYLPARSANEDGDYYP